MSQQTSLVLGSVISFPEQPAPATPPSGTILLYADSTTGELTALTSSGSAPIGGGTVGPGVSGQLAVYSGTTSVAGSSVSGDLTATDADFTVAKLQSIPLVYAPVPSAGQALIYDGVNWTPVFGPGGTNQILYFNNTATFSHKTWATTVDTSVEHSTASAITVGTSPFTLESFYTVGGYPDLTLVPAGNWQWDVYMQVNIATGTTTAYAQVLKRSSGGVETPLFDTSGSPITISQNGTGVNLYTFESVQPGITILANDTLVCKIVVTVSANCTVTIYYDGTNHYSHCHTPIGANAGVPVSSVFGRVGAVVATTADYTVAQVTGAAPSASPTFTGVVEIASGTAAAPSLSFSSATTTGLYLESSVGSPPAAGIGISVAGVLAASVLDDGIQIPSTSVYMLGTDTGISRDSTGVVDIGNNIQGNKSGTVNATTANFTGTTTVGTLAATTINGAALSGSFTGTAAVTVASLAVTTAGNTSSVVVTGNGTPTTPVVRIINNITSGAYPALYVADLDNYAYSAVGGLVKLELINGGDTAPVLLIANAGSGNDITGTSWSVKSGVFTVSSSAGITQTALTPTSIATKGGIVTTFSGTSDERLKETKPYAGGLDKILAINPVSYTWNKAGQKHTGFPDGQVFVGFTAQDVQKAIPEAVTGTEGEGYLSFDDRPIIAALVNAVKQLKAEIEVLKQGRV
jgi:hypothetical protein